MSISPSELRPPLARNVAVTDDTLVVDLLDGRTVSAPLAWYPRLVHGTPEGRARWRLIGHGEGTRTSASQAFSLADRRESLSVP